MNQMTSFVAGLVVGVTVCLLTLAILKRWRCAGQARRSDPAGEQPHVDSAAASQIAHDKGIEVFDD